MQQDTSGVHALTSGEAQQCREEQAEHEGHGTRAQAAGTLCKQRRRAYSQLTENTTWLHTDILEAFLPPFHSWTPQWVAW